VHSLLASDVFTLSLHDALPILRSSLSFSGSRFQVAVPWSALFAIASHVTHEFWMFPEDLPPELIENQQASDTASPPPAAPSPARDRQSPRLNSSHATISHAVFS